MSLRMEGGGSVEVVFGTMEALWKQYGGSVEAAWKQDEGRMGQCGVTTEAMWRYCIGMCEGTIEAV